MTPQGGRNTAGPASGKMGGEGEVSLDCLTAFCPRNRPHVVLGELEQEQEWSLLLALLAWPEP